MDMLEILDQVREQLEQKGRLSYRLLQKQFGLDDDGLDDLKYELIDIQQVATDKDDKMLVWTGDEPSEETAPQTVDSPATASLSPVKSPKPEREAPAGERRQLTVMFCDLVGSTALSEQLDPEELQAVVRTYQEVSARVIERYEGYIAQYLGDGLLVYFGYPAAHEDDAARAISAGLEIVSALHQARSQFLQPVQVRIGIHTGPVVIGQMGGGSRHEQLALGETPNIAARVQGKAEPDEVVISATTQRLVTGLFETEDCGLTELRGISTPQAFYRVVAESEAQSRFEVAVRTGLTPFIGREEELSLLRHRWERALAGDGQVVLLAGEPGIGKSRLLQELKDYTAAAAPLAVECRCSAHLHNSALAPVIGHVERVLGIERTDSPEAKLHKLEHTRATYDFVLPDTVPLLATLLSVPLPETSAPLQSSPQKQKARTLELLVTWLRKDAERQPLRIEFEDLHWADPSTLEFLSLLVEQVPTMSALLVLTFRPEFTPPWPARAQVLPLHLDRLAQPQIIEMAKQVAGKTLPAEVIAQMVAKTDGVPLFVEELTKTVVESGQLHETATGYELRSSLQQVDIPITLQDSLRARLDRLNAAQGVAQVGATIGREFSYELVQAVSALDESVLQQGLRQLVDADLVFQKGLPPHAQYVFKHALVQDSAYQSLLKSRRQQLHAQTAQVLAQQFAETVATQPELLAHHYTEASLVEQAIPYWQAAGQGAVQRSANSEAISHLTTGLQLLKTLPASSERLQKELLMQITLGVPLTATKGYADPEVGAVFERARVLSQQIGETPELFMVLFGLWGFHIARGKFHEAREVAEQQVRLAQRVQNPAMLAEAYSILGTSLVWLGELVSGRDTLAQAIALYTPQMHNPAALQDAGVISRIYQAWALWYLGYPDQALKKNQEALALARQLSHFHSLAIAQVVTAVVHQLRHDVQATHEQAAEVRALSTEQGYPHWLAMGGILGGWALTERGQVEAGTEQMLSSIVAYRAIGSETVVPYQLRLLAQVYEKVGKTEEGLRMINDGLTVLQKGAQGMWEAEVYQLKGELILQAAEHGQASPTEQDAEDCFRTALEVACHRSAKSMELRAAMSLARLWQRQDKTVEARALLAPVYNWFTEGFDTADLKDAKGLLEELA